MSSVVFNNVMNSSTVNRSEWRRVDTNGDWWVPLNTFIHSFISSLSLYSLCVSHLKVSVVKWVVSANRTNGDSGGGWGRTQSYKAVGKIAIDKKENKQKTAERFQKHSTKTLHPPENVLSGISSFFQPLYFCYYIIQNLWFLSCSVTVVFLISCAAALCLNQLLQCLKTILVGGGRLWLEQNNKKGLAMVFFCCCFAFHFSAVEGKNANKTQINRMWPVSVTHH